jgi:hypothetical protein
MDKSLDIYVQQNNVSTWENISSISSDVSCGIKHYRLFVSLCENKSLRCFTLSTNLYRAVDPN